MTYFNYITIQIFSSEINLLTIKNGTLKIANIKDPAFSFLQSLTFYYRIECLHFEYKPELDLGRQKWIFPGFDPLCDSVQERQNWIFPSPARACILSGSTRPCNMCKNFNKKKLFLYIKNVLIFIATNQIKIIVASNSNLKRFHFFLYNF